MLVTLQNDILRVAIEDAGAQLASIRDRNGEEYLWQGDEAVWPRRAPLLFPIIARLKDSRYTLQGESYTIPTHGFCRSAPFALLRSQAQEAVFSYSDTEETRRVYPFSFRLSVTYTLRENSLIKTHLVENLSDRPMPYELGGHDGFRAPVSEGERMDDYALRLPGLDAVTPYGMDSENMITPKTVTHRLNNGRMPLRPSAYGLDTIILDDLPRRRAELVDGADRVRVAVDFGDFGFAGFWTAAKDFDTNYVCIEPWTSLPDATFVGRELTDKRGVRILAPGARETLRYTASFFPRA